MAQKKQAWGSRIGLILAMAGSAVGIGNFIRFPVQAVQNGGGAFIIPYIVSFLVLGIPLVLIEWSLGKYAGQFGHHSPPTILPTICKGKIFRYVGSISIFASAIICSYYCFIESWILSYAIHSIIGTFNGMNEYEVSNFFDTYIDLGTSTLGIPGDTMIAFVVCLAINVVILSGGIKKGIETSAKICMPLLLIFGIFLIFKAYTMKAGVDGASFDSSIALNFLWTPDYSSLTNPKVWLSAAGQIFFTLSLGLGVLHTYASYMKKDDDIALNSLTSAFTNEVGEVILGSAIIIPIAIGYFGVDKMMELTQLGGFSLGFRTMPYLFEQWGPILSAFAGLTFFGILFLASITSSVSMGQPFIAFLSQRNDWSQKKSSLVYGFILLLLALPSILFFNQGVFDQYDFWAGTVCLFLFGMIEVIAFSWIMGLDKGWELITNHADIQIPKIYKYILKYITPTMLIIIFLAALIKPINDDWSQLSFNGWEVDGSSIIGELTHKNIGPNQTWFADNFYAENEGIVKSISDSTILIGEKSYTLPKDAKILVAEEDMISIGTPIYEGDIINNIFYIDMSRISLVVILLIICILVKFSNVRIYNSEI